MSNRSFQGPRCTVDVLCYRFTGERLQVMFVERKYEPYQHQWAIPGGFVESDETIREAAHRELEEETSLKVDQLRQFRSYGGPDRDPRGPVVTVCYTALVPPGHSSGKADSDARTVEWHRAHEPPRLAFDHRRILTDANAHLAERFRRTPDAFHLLPDPFSMNKVHRLYERSLQKSIEPSLLTDVLLDNQLVTPVSDEMEDAASETRYTLRTDRFKTYTQNHMPLPF